MWKIIRLTFLGIILLIIDIYGISGSEDCNKIPAYPESITLRVLIRTEYKKSDKCESNLRTKDPRHIINSKNQVCCMGAALQICILLFLVFIVEAAITQFYRYTVSVKFTTLAITLVAPLLKQEEERNISILETEPGFNYTEAEMKKLKIWPGGVVPYYIDTLSFGAEFRKILNRILQAVSKAFGVQFLELQRPPPPQKNTRWVLFLNRRGALRSEGYTTKDFTTYGVQNVVMGTNSAFNGELHEIILAIFGVPPQHNAPNRDTFITIHYDNIIPDKRHLFDKLKNDEWLFHDLKYDYFSAGHYGLYKHAIKGFATIEAMYDVGASIGENGGFSLMDIQKVRMMYNYISKSRSKLMKKSDCSKMFKPGPKIKDNIIEPLWQTPRPKPKQYLGVTDDKNDNNNLESKEEKVKWKPPKRKPIKPTTRKPTKQTTIKRTTTNKPKTTTSKTTTSKTTTSKSEEDGNNTEINISVGDININVNPPVTEKETEPEEK